MDGYQGRGTDSDRSVTLTQGTSAPFLGWTEAGVSVPGDNKASIISFVQVELFPVRCSGWLELGAKVQAIGLHVRESQTTWADLPAKGEDYWLWHPYHLGCLPVQMWFAGLTRPSAAEVSQACPVPHAFVQHAPCSTRREAYQGPWDKMLVAGHAGLWLRTALGPRLIQVPSELSKDGSRTVGLRVPPPLKLCPLSALSRWQPKLASTTSSTSWGSLSWKAWRTSPCQGSATAGRSRAETQSPVMLGTSCRPSSCSLPGRLGDPKVSLLQMDTCQLPGET